MADSQASFQQESGLELAGGRDAQLALLMTARWRDEIEQAVDRVKKSVNRTELDRWFRKQWYRCQAVRLRQERRLARQRTNQHQTGKRGGDEDGKRRRRSGRPLGASRRPIGGDAVLCGSALAAVQEREEAARVLGFRQ